MNDAVLAQVSALPKMGTDELKQLWHKLFDTTPPNRCHKTLMIRKLAYRLQELAYGIDPDIETRIAEHAKRLFTKSGKLQKRFAAGPTYTRPLTGTKLVRTYKGVQYQVEVLANGYEYQGCLYKSLSKIATAITGCSWSGPAFFGLRQPKGVKQ